MSVRRVREALARVGLSLAFAPSTQAAKIADHARSSVQRGERQLPRVMSDRWLQAAYRNHGDDLMRVVRSTRSTGAIVCSFHLGAHISIPWMLAKSGYDVSTLVDGANFWAATAPCQRSSSLTSASYPNSGLLNANSPTAAFQMWKRLERGGIVFVYADGNAGHVSSATGNYSSRLFGRSVRMKAGWVDLAVTLGVPIHLVVADDVEDPEERPPFISQSWHDELDCVASTTSVLRWLHSRLESEVAAAPWAWEEWHQFVYWVDLSGDLVESDRSWLRRVKSGVSVEVNGATICLDTRRNVLALLNGSQVSLIGTSTWDASMSSGRTVSLARE